MLMLDGLACFIPGPLDILVSSRTSTQKIYYSIVFSAFSENQNYDISNLRKIFCGDRKMTVDTAFESPNHVLLIFDNYLSESLN